MGVRSGSRANWVLASVDSISLLQTWSKFDKIESAHSQDTQASLGKVTRSQNQYHGGGNWNGDKKPVELHGDLQGVHGGHNVDDFALVELLPP